MVEYKPAQKATGQYSLIDRTKNTTEKRHPTSSKQYQVDNTMQRTKINIPKRVSVLNPTRTT